MNQDPSAIEREILAELHILRGATVRQLSSRLGLDPFLVRGVLMGAGSAVDVKNDLWCLTPVRWGGMRVAS